MHSWSLSNLMPSKIVQWPFKILVLDFIIIPHDNYCMREQNPPPIRLRRSTAWVFKQAIGDGRKLFSLDLWQTLNSKIHEFYWESQKITNIGNVYVILYQGKNPIWCEETEVQTAVVWWHAQDNKIYVHWRCKHHSKKSCHICSNYQYWIPLSAEVSSHWCSVRKQTIYIKSRYI